MEIFDFCERSELLIGYEALQKLKNSTVLVAGVGGVGSFAAEALIRAGIGRLIMIDYDRVALSNLNRQLPALRKNIGRYKTEVLKERFAEINRDAEIISLVEKISDNQEQIASVFDGSRLPQPDFLIDAIDDLRAKSALLIFAYNADLPCISVMGTGRRLDPGALKVCDIYETAGDPLASRMRSILRKAGVKRLLTVFSDEPPVSNELIRKNMQRRKERLAAESKPEADDPSATDAAEAADPSATEAAEADDSVASAKESGPAGANGDEPASTKEHVRMPVASISFVPPAAGYIAASQAVKAILSK